jgi:hypothetical protein
MNNPLYNAIFQNAMTYFKKEIQKWVILSRESGIPSSVRVARLNRARKVSAECRTFRNA